MIGNYSTIEVEPEEIEYKNVNITSIYLAFLLYDTYQPLYCTGHIHMTNYYNTVIVKKKTAE